MSTFVVHLSGRDVDEATMRAYGVVKSKDPTSLAFSEPVPDAGPRISTKPRFADDAGLSSAMRQPSAETKRFRS
jgi:hypothetical protein